MKRKQSVLCCLIALLVCAFGLPALAQPKLDQAAVEQWRGDLRYLADELPKRHYNLFYTLSREQFEQSVKRLDERIPSLNPQQIFVEMLRIVAKVEDGHTLITKRDMQGFTPRRYPLTLYLYRDGLFVQAASPEYARAVGGRVVKIGNATAEQAIRAVRDIISRDNEMNLKQRLPRWLIMAEALYGLGLIEDMENARFVVDQRGEQVAIDLKPISYETTVKWVDARDSATPAPLWLKDPQKLYWFEYLADSRAVYVQYNACANKREESVAGFFKRVFAFVDANTVDRFVLDIRMNHGGNSNLNLPIIHGLIRSDKINQPGKLFVIIGRGTFSAAVRLVGDLDRHTHAIFIGEPTGGKPNHFGGAVRSGDGMESFMLPHSRLVVEYSNVWMQRGQADDFRPWKAPHRAAELTSVDYRANNDPAMKLSLNYTPQEEVSDRMLEILQANEPAKGMDAALKLYREEKSDPASAFADLSSDLDLVGRRLMSANRLNDALRIFTINVEDHPRSDLAYSGLGDLYRKLGNKELAIQSYLKAVELNPKNWGAIDKLKTLR